MRILINTPCLDLLGGVANHYLGLKDFWSEKVRYNTVGKRSKKGKGIYWLPWDVVKFIFKLLWFRPDVVLLNPSLGNSALKRDFIFLNIAHLLRFKVAIFFHGFNLDYANKVNNNWIASNLNKASLLIVLANQFKNIIMDWGVTTPICLTTTKVDDKLIEKFDIHAHKNFKQHNFLCVTRIEKSKGIYEALDTFKLTRDKYSDVTFTLVGDGSELEAAREYTNKQKIEGVRFTGRLDGDNLISEFEKATFFLFLSYGEGMPTCVLEAMAFGLPVFTRNVGGLVDFFEQDKMGFISDSLDPKDFANAIMQYIENPEKTRKASLYNYQYAKNHFLASSVAIKLENILRNAISE